MRASLAVSFVAAGSIEYPFHDKQGAAAGSGAGGATTPGTAPLEHAAAGSTVQGIADAAGSGVNWQSIAAANGIENPRLLAPGTLLDLNLQAPTIATGFGVPDALEVGPPQLSASVPVRAGADMAVEIQEVEVVPAPTSPSAASGSNSTKPPTVPAPRSSLN